jgi:TolB-like protein
MAAMARAASKRFPDGATDSARASWKKTDRSRIGLPLVRPYRMGLIRWPMLTLHRRNPCRQPHRRPICGRGTGNARFYGGVIGFLCAALIAYGWQGFRTDTPTRPIEPPRLSIVVLPFASASGTSKDEELAAALTDDFMTDLAQIRGSVVVARSMAQAIAARKLPLPVVGHELAVRYVLEGNIRRSPEGIELNLQLSDAASATSIWTRQFKETASESDDLRLQVSQNLLFPLRTAFMDAEARRVSSLPERR